MFKSVILILLAIILVEPKGVAQPKNYTSSEILLQLKKLNTAGSVLYIAAHPDDENTRLISYLANEKCLRTGYLSLTRGDGGQNLIGPEQGIELGIIRTQELLAARRTDGGEQFFTRAYDFGYSKSPEETFNKWNKDSLLGDMVWVIRNFKPDIIITRFSTDGSGGHGHHTASAILAEEAFDAAADPSRYANQLKYVDVWKTSRLFHNSTARFFNPNADLSYLKKVDVGGYNVLLGKNYGEIAADSRSNHKSQGFGSARQRGEMLEYFKPIKGDTANLTDIFSGMDFTWNRYKNTAFIGSALNVITANYNINQPDLSTLSLINLYKKIDKNKEVSQTIKDFILPKINNCILLTAGIFIERNANQYTFLSIGDSIFAKNFILNRGSLPIKIQPNNILLEPNKPYLYDDTTFYMVEGDFTKYFAMQPIQIQYSQYPNGLFEQNNLQLIGLPEYTGNEGTCQFLIEVSGHLIGKEINATYKWTDPEKGELHRNLLFVPPVYINPLLKNLMFNDLTTKNVSISLKASKYAVNGNLLIDMPAGWELNALNDISKNSKQINIPFSLQKQADEIIVQINVKPPANASVQNLNIIAQIDGNTTNTGFKEIKYNHIPIQTWYPEAKINLVKLDAKIISKNIAYIEGAGDDVAEGLKQLGYQVTNINDNYWNTSVNLNKFSAIIIGVRAFNTSEILHTKKQFLMDYVNNGGNLIVQYQTNSWAGPLKDNIGPYPFKITRNRITDENAKVNLLEPNHAIFNKPNKITDADFEDWVQERSIYHAGDWDKNYTALISMADPNDNTDNGALIVAKFGKGNFMYTGLSLFRQLPAGKPGAYKLFANLIELGR